MPLLENFNYYASIIKKENKDKTTKKFKPALTIFHILIKHYQEKMQLAPAANSSFISSFFPAPKDNKAILITNLLATNDFNEYLS